MSKLPDKPTPNAGSPIASTARPSAKSPRPWSEVVQALADNLNKNAGKDSESSPKES